MKAPVSWLREYCDPGWPAEELAERLAMTGTEVERVTVVGAPTDEGFVIGRVLSAEPHPDADRLRVCSVDVGDGEPRTIVCGAANVAAGQTVAVALPGAVMPGGQPLGRAKLRGVESEGMILSETEMEIGQDAEGIAVLDDGPAPGQPLGEVLPVSDRVLELEVTPNRVDCYGVYGVAREVHAISGAPLAPPPWAPDAGATGDGEAADHASLEVLDPDLCPRFTARVFTDVRVGPSPLWLKARLSSAGMRPINNVVDITNYAMLLTAQPLHAFDLDLVRDGKLIIRRAGDGETMVTLDGEERRFDADTMLVCDSEGPSGIAGIMGGRRSEVSDATTRVLLEVATWDGVNILRTSNLLALRSEASTRFEKQLHPALCMRAQAVASRLLVELCGARLVPGTLDAAAEAPEPRRLVLRMARIERLLGDRIEAESATTYLERLGFAVERDGGELRVEVPPDRHHDVSREADLIEEVARIHGLERLPTTLPSGSGRVGALGREQTLRRRAEDALRGLGFNEVVGWSFADAGLADRLRLSPEDPRRSAVTLRNPLSEEHALMRTTLLGSLLDAARHNSHRGADRVALFESGRVYLKYITPFAQALSAASEGRQALSAASEGRQMLSAASEGRQALSAAAEGAGSYLDGVFAGNTPSPAHEPHRLGALVVGSLHPAGWRGAAVPADFFALKAVVESLAGQLGAVCAFEPSDEPFLHPGRAAAVSAADRPCGWLGELHPLVTRAWDLDSAAGFELDLGALVVAAGIGQERYEDVTTYPAVYEDLAIVVDEGVSAERVRAAVIEGGGELLRASEVFDLYRGEQVGEGGKSLALRLEFRAPDRTLTDAEVSERRKAITAALDAIGGSIRDH